MDQRLAPRVVIAGLSGDAGKTLVSLALLLALKRRGVSTRAFKKGPDYVDAAWLTWASAHPARNLDTYMMGPERVAGSFAQHSMAEGVNLIEANRGLFDGFDTAGTHSSAELAKLLDAPVVLVLDATKITRTAAALVLGCQKFDPELRLAGVILNRVNGTRHERILRECIEGTCGIPVLGTVPKLDLDAHLPERHLGLVTPQEHGDLDRLNDMLAEEVARGLQIDRLQQIAAGAPPLRCAQLLPPQLPDGRGLTIGYLKDSAFTFYYAENLEILEQAGAELVPLSALTAEQIPPNLDALYIGGGFPETHADRLSANIGFLFFLRKAAESGLPIYAECGGLMLLARAIVWRGRRFPMAGVFDFDVQVCDKPQGHGYAELHVDRANAFFPFGLALRGHEFHYSQIVPEGPPLATACAVSRGTGCYPGRDGLIAGNVWAAYTHLHALATPEWGAAMINAAQAYRNHRQAKAALSAA
jgi:cobyrinic acid a,c-diamide synthase